MVIDGDKIDGNLRATSALAQFFKRDTSACIPDWTVPANQPIIYPVLRSQNEGTVKSIVANTEQWYYNGVLMTFNASGIATAPAAVANRAKKISHNNGTVNVPALQLIGNLASAENADADVIRMTGDIEASGHQLKYDIFIGLEIAEYSDSEYTGFLSATNGGIIDEEGETILVTPTLYRGGSKMTGGYTQQWLKPPYTAAYSTAGAVTIGRADINSRLDLMCRFLVNDAVVDTRLISLSDEVDSSFIVAEASGTTMLESTGVNSSVDLTYKVKKRGTGEVQTGYTFTTVMTGARGQSVTLANEPTATGCKVTYADAKAAGGNIAGFVTGIKG